MEQGVLIVTILFWCAVSSMCKYPFPLQKSSFPETEIHVRDGNITPGEKFLLHQSMGLSVAKTSRFQLLLFMNLSILVQK